METLPNQEQHKNEILTGKVLRYDSDVLSKKNLVILDQ